MGMTRDDAWSWLCAHLGPMKAETVIRQCLKHSDALEAIATTIFHASDPRRQKLRQAVRALMDETKGTK